MSRQARFLFFSLIIFFTFYFINLPPVAAHCPLCIAGAGFGLSLSRILGIDDSITGLWLAALLGSTSFYFSTFTLRRFKFPFKKLIIYLLVFLSTLWSFYRFNLVDVHAGDIFGFHKLTFGLIVGSLIFYLTDQANQLLVSYYGRPLFPYQRLLTSLGVILLFSLLDYLLINYLI